MPPASLTLKTPSMVEAPGAAWLTSPPLSPLAPLLWPPWHLLFFKHPKPWLQRLEQPLTLGTEGVALRWCILLTTRQD